jgi:hypothetical protein
MDEAITSECQCRAEVLAYFSAIADKSKMDLYFGSVMLGLIPTEMISPPRRLEERFTWGLHLTYSQLIRYSDSKANF